MDFYNYYEHQLREMIYEEEQFFKKKSDMIYPQFLFNLVVSNQFFQMPLSRKIKAIKIALEEHKEIRKRTIIYSSINETVYFYDNNYVHYKVDLHNQLVSIDFWGHHSDLRKD